MLHLDKDLSRSFGSFWSLFNRIKRGRGDTIVAVTCPELSWELDDFLKTAEPVVLVQHPGGIGSGRWRDSLLSSLALAPKPVSDVVVLVHQSCRFTEGRSSEDHAYRMLRRVASVEPIAERISKRRVSLHLLQVGERGQLLVFHPEQRRFVSPLAAA